MHPIQVRCFGADDKSNYERTKEQASEAWEKVKEKAGTMSEEVEAKRGRMAPGPEAFEQRNSVAVIRAFFAIVHR